MRRAIPLLLLIGCGFRTPWQEQRSYADTLKPAEVARNPTVPASAARVFRVRAYADADYQAQTPRWNQHIAEQGTLPEDLEGKLRDAVEEFKGQFAPSGQDKAPKEAEAGELEGEEGQEKMKKKVRRKPPKEEK